MFQNKLQPYKGFGFDYEVEYQDDNVKVTHYLVHPDGRQEYIDFSPYFYCSQRAFEAWIDAGFPPARQFGYDWKEPKAS